MPRSSKMCLLIQILYAFMIPPMHAISPVHLILLDFIILLNVRWRAQVMKLLITKCFSILLSCPFRSMQFPQHPALEHSQFMCFPITWTTKFRINISWNRQITVLYILISTFFASIQVMIKKWLWSIFCYYRKYFLVPEFIQTSYIPLTNIYNMTFVYKMCKAQQMSPFSNITWTVSGSIRLSEPRRHKQAKISNLISC
jgi:hypothetical protein